jgi:hypothetical protein
VHRQGQWFRRIAIKLPEQICLFLLIVDGTRLRSNYLVSYAPIMALMSGKILCLFPPILLIIFILIPH